MAGLLCDYGVQCVACVVEIVLATRMASLADLDGQWRGSEGAVDLKGGMWHGMEDAATHH